MTTTNGIQTVIHSTEEIPINDRSTSKVVDNIESNEIPTCRICMESQLEDSNPIMPLGCSCYHGLSRAHRHCLVKWFCQRRFDSIIHFNGKVNYKQCEICRENLSPSIQELLNVQFEQAMVKYNISQGVEVMVAQTTTHETTQGAVSRAVSREHIWLDLQCDILMVTFVRRQQGFLLPPKPKWLRQ